MLCKPYTLDFSRHGAYNEGEGGQLKAAKTLAIYAICNLATW